MHGALATCKGTFVVKQILLLKLQTCIPTGFFIRTVNFKVAIKRL